MDINEIKKKKQHLIASSNPEWQVILDLRSAVQRDIRDSESLTIPIYIKILEWKLGKQRSRIEKI